MLTENLDLFLSDFGVNATLNGVTTLRVLFEREYSPIEFGAEGHSITATTRTDAVSGVHHGDSLLIEGHTYKVIGIHPIQDGKFTELVLKE